MISILSPEQYHAKNHRGPLGDCWLCGRARARCREKIHFGSWQEAEEWVREFNESHRYETAVTRYRCRWCGGWHMANTAGAGHARKRAEKQRRKWLVRQKGGAER